MRAEHHGSQFLIAPTQHAPAAAWVLAFLAAVLGAFTAAPASAATGSAAQNAVGASASEVPVAVGPSPGVVAGQRLGNDPPQPGIVVATGVAANTAARADIAGARFAQSSYSEMFSSGGRFAGQSIDDVAGSLRSGALLTKDVPIDVIVRDGNSLILNTRSSQALIRAGFPRSSWNVIDRTGQAAYEARLSGKLGRNGLTSYGTHLP